MRYAALVFFVIIVSCAWPGAVNAAGDGRKYVGSKQCKSCHEEEYQNFVNHSKQAKSYESVVTMSKGLAKSELQGCYKCHTTGYGQPGGFRSMRETPQLKEAGCETCHGPGSIHCETGDKKDIRGKLGSADCKQCHTDRIVGAFGLQPMVYGGVH